MLDSIGTIFKSIIGNLNTEDDEYYSNCINESTNDAHQLENLIKNQISITTYVFTPLVNTPFVDSINCTQD